MHCFFLFGRAKIQNPQTISVPKIVVNQTLQPVAIKRGILYVNGKQRYFVSGEYPYYRDQREQWTDRLEKMKLAGINMITCWVPWRHHVLSHSNEGTQKFDFTGETQANRDLRGFLTRIQQLHLFVTLKLGPFCEANLDYGGLPDFICPTENNHITPYRNHLFLNKRRESSINRWPPITGKPLPSPNDPEFKRFTTEFFQAIRDQILDANIYPQGPIMTLHILNQGFFTTGNWGFPYAADYSILNMQKFRTYLKSRYRTEAIYNHIHNTTVTSFQEIHPPTLYRGNQAYHDIRDFQNVIDWMDYRVINYAQWINEMKCALKVDPMPPILTTFSAPCNFGIGLDVWYAWVNFEKLHHLTGIHYAYSNWMEPLSHQNANYARYGALCSRAPGFNMEENWGFAKIFDKKHRYATTNIYQTLLACAYGSTGYNINAAVSTDFFTHYPSNSLDTRSDIPYPSHAPITADGKLTTKYYMMAGLNKFFGRYYGKDFLASHEECLFGLGYYAPYAGLAAFAGHDPKVWKKIQFHGKPVFGQDAFIEFFKALRHMKLGFEIINLEYPQFMQQMPTAQESGISTENSLKFRSKFLIFVSTEVLGKQVQKTLVEYVAQGGILCLFGEMPQYDENFQPCQILQEAFPQFNNQRIIQKKCINEKVCYTSNDQGGFFLFRKGNPLESPRGVLYYTLDFIIRTFFMPLQLRISNNRVFHGKILPYATYQRLLGLDGFIPQLKRNSLKTFNLLLRFLQQKGIHREVEITLRTDYLFRRKIEVFVYTHPQYDQQFIFLFSKQTNWTLPVTVHLYYPERKISLRIKTKILGRTAQLLRIVEGKLTGIVYIGFNPITHAKKALEISINKYQYSTDHPMDLILLTQDQQGEIYLGNTAFKGTSQIHGFTTTPLEVQASHKYYPFNKTPKK